MRRTRFCHAKHRPSFSKYLTGDSARYTWGGTPPGQHLLKGKWPITFCLERTELAIKKGSRERLLRKSFGRIIWLASIFWAAWWEFGWRFSCRLGFIWTNLRKFQKAQILTFHIRPPHILSRVLIHCQIATDRLRNETKVAATATMLPPIPEELAPRLGPLTTTAQSYRFC